jgi:hypothetical protein
MEGFQSLRFKRNFFPLCFQPQKIPYQDFLITRCILMVLEALKKNLCINKEMKIVRIITIPL